MKTINGLEILKNHKGEIWHTFNGSWQTDSNPQLKKIANDIIHTLKKTSMIKETKDFFVTNLLEKYYDTKEALKDTLHAEETKKTIVNNLINFFTEFDFTPAFRYVNTLARIVKNEGYEAAKAYTVNYFDLSCNMNTQSISEKVKSSEFTAILDGINSLEITNKINRRLEIYYGAAGTGKTTDAMNKADNRVMVCHSAMLPQDLFEVFDFEKGEGETSKSPTFKKSPLQIAMEKGQTIVLDEINLLPMETVRALQEILDNKSEFILKDASNPIHIKEGFKIIGTMNLTVNGQEFPLPEPLIDRAEVIKKYTVNVDNLIGALN